MFRAKFIRMLASAVRPAAAQTMCESIWYIFSLYFERSRSLEVCLRSAAITIPSEQRTPTVEPALLIASIAYSTCIRRP